MAGPFETTLGSRGGRRVASVRRPSGAAVLVGLAAFSGGCLATRPGPVSATLPEGAAVVITLRQARDDLQLRCGDQRRSLGGVVGVAGRVRRVANDTLELAASSFRVAGERESRAVPRDCLVKLVRDAGTSLVILSRRPARIEAGLALGALAFIVSSLLFAWAVTRGGG